MAAFALLLGGVCTSGIAIAAQPVSTNNNSRPDPSDESKTRIKTAEEIIDGISLCMRAVQPGKNLLEGEFENEGWTKKPLPNPTDESGYSYTGYLYEKSTISNEIRVAEGVALCTNKVGWVNDKKAKAVEDILTGRLGGVPSDQQEGFDELTYALLEGSSKTDGWGKDTQQLSEKLFYFSDAAVAVEIVMFGYNPMMVSTIIPIQNK